MALEKGIAALDQYRSQFENTDLFPAASAEDITAAQLQLRNALGLTDYSTQSKAAQDTARLNFALSLAQRGFEMAGATPREGESPISTMSRAIAPLAGDARAIASDYMKQKAAFDLAQQQEERQIKLLGYQSAQARLDKQSSALASLLPELIKGPAWKHSLKQEQDLSVLLGEGDNQQKVTGMGSILFSIDDKGNTQAHTATAIEGRGADGKPVMIPQGTPVPAFSKWVKPSEDKYGAQALYQNVSPLTVSFMRGGERITVAPRKSVWLDKNELGVAKKQLASQEDPRNFADVFRPLSEQTLPAQSFIANVWDGTAFNQRRIIQQTIFRDGIPLNQFYVEDPITKTLNLVDDPNTIVAATDNQLPFKLSDSVYVTDATINGLPEGAQVGDKIDIYTSQPNPEKPGGTIQKRFVFKGDVVSIRRDVVKTLPTVMPDTAALERETLYVWDTDAVEKIFPNAVDNAEISSTTQWLNGVKTTQYYLGGIELDAAKVQKLVLSGALQTTKKPKVGESKQFVYLGTDITEWPPGTRKLLYNQKVRLTAKELAAYPKSVQDKLADLVALDRNQEHHLITKKIIDETGEVIWLPGWEWYGDQQQATAFRDKYGQDVITNWDKAKALLIRRNSLQNVFTSLVNEKYPDLDAAHADFKLTEVEKDGLLGLFPAVGRTTAYATALRNELLQLLSRKMTGRIPAAGASQVDTDASIAAEDIKMGDRAASARLVATTDAEELTYSEMSGNRREKARTRPDTGWDALHARGLVAEPWEELSFERQQAFSLIGGNSPELKDPRKVAPFINKAFEDLAARKAKYTHPTGDDVAEYQNLIRVYATLKQIRDGGYLRDTGIIKGVFATFGTTFADWPNIVFDENTERLTVLISQLRSSIEFINQSEARPSDWRSKIKLDILPTMIRAQAINDKNVALALDNLENHIQSYFDPSVTATSAVPPAFEQAASQVGIKVTPTERAKYPWIDFDGAKPIFLMKDFLEGIGVRRAGWADFEAAYIGQPVRGLNVPEDQQEWIGEKYPNATDSYYIRLDQIGVAKHAKNAVNKGLKINPKGAYVILVIQNGGLNHENLYIPKLFDMSESFGKR